MKSTRHAASTCASVLAFALAGLLTACSDNTESNVAANNTPENVAADTTAAATSTLKHENVAYVSNQDGGVAVIDLDTMQSIGSIDPQAGGPRGIGITDDGKMLVTANKDEGNISVLDPATGALIRKIEIGKNPEFVRVKGNLAFVTFEPSSEGGPPPKPGQAAAEEEEDDDDDGPKEPARVAIVDLEQGKKLREIVGGPETEGIEFSKDGSKVIITNEADNTITVHDINTGELLKTINTEQYGKRPRGIKISPDGNTYVSTLEFGNSFLVMDSDFNPVRAVKTGVGPYGIAYGPDGERIFVASNKDQVLQVFDAKTYEKIKDVPVGKRCWHFTFTPDNKDILLACGRSHEVLVIDADKLEVTKHLGEKELPWGIITYPKSTGRLYAPV